VNLLSSFASTSPAAAAAADDDDDDDDDDDGAAAVGGGGGSLSLLPVRTLMCLVISTTRLSLWRQGWLMGL